MTPPCPWPPPDLSLRDISKAKAKEISGGSVLDATAARHGRDQLTYKTVKAIERGRLPKTAPPSGVGHKGCCGEPGGGQCKAGRQ